VKHSVTKKALALISASAIMVSLTGCRSVFSGSYTSVTDHVEEADSQITVSEDYIEVSDYTALKDAVSTLVSSHAETGRIRFSSYSGDPESDLSDACREVYRNTALGAYAVDYMSHTITRIVSYYEADINITYRRTQDELDEIIQVSNLSGLDEIFSGAIGDFETGLVLQTGRVDLDADYVTDWFKSYFAENPMSTLAMPQVTVASYPDSGVQRILEVAIDYVYSEDELPDMKKELMDEAVAMVGTIKYTDVTAAETALSVCEAIMALSQHSSTGSGDLYDLMINGIGGSLGFAQTFKFIGGAAGLDCQLVSGTRSGEEYYWNIVCIDGIYYHIDCMDCAENGLDSGFLKSDSEMSRYSWNTSDYPVCDSVFTDVIS
jgi:hypothetical protein